MAKIRLAGTNTVLFEFSNIMMDEFIPVVEFDRNSFDATYGFLSADSKEVILSEYVEENLRKVEPKVIDTECRKIKLPFNVIKGSSKTSDLDGIIETKLSISDPEVQIVGSKSFKTKYGGVVELEIEIKKKERVEFYIDFYASDDTEGEYNKGELEEIHCGRVKVVFAYTVTTDWETIAPVIPKSKFVGWGHPGVKENCFHYALEQLKQVNHGVKSENWGTKTKINDFIFQLFLEKDVAGMKKGFQKDQFEPGVEYLKKTLKTGIPVLAGVDDGSSNINKDKTTEHFITIVGMGEDSTGKYFLFYDNAVPNKEIGTSDKNKLYCIPSQCILEGTGDLRNGYIQQSPKKKYIVTQIRETK